MQSPRLVVLLFFPAQVPLSFVVKNIYENFELLDTAENSRLHPAPWKSGAFSAA
jgi:hypothetical protein